MAVHKLDLNIKSLTEDGPVEAKVDGKKFAVVLHKGKVYALNGVCTHMGGPLGDGKVEGDEIVCPWHAGKYNIMTGKANPDTKWVHDTETCKVTQDKSGELSVEM